MDYEQVKLDAFVDELMRIKEAAVAPTPGAWGAVKGFFQGGVRGLESLGRGVKRGWSGTGYTPKTVPGAAGAEQAVQTVAKPSGIGGALGEGWRRAKLMASTPQGRKQLYGAGALIGGTGLATYGAGKGVGIV